jgi:signal peptidase I
MNFDFSLILASLSIITGLIWALDHFILSRKRALAGNLDDKTGEIREPLFVEYSRFLFPVVFTVFLLRGFIAEPFRIPSGSMLPTLEIGDFILVNKFSYGVRVPVINQKILDFGGPERGDVIVFRYPENPSLDYIKRVVGVPGDEIAYYNKIVHVNGKKVDIKPVGVYQPGFPNVKRFNENLIGIEHDILIDDLRPAGDFIQTVPEGSYFVLGDNRDNSRDSRYWGYVPDENLVGKAFLVWLNWKWGSLPQFGRIGTIID